MNFGLNLKDASYTFYNSSQDPVRVPAHCAVRLSAFKNPPACLTSVKSFVNYMIKRGVEKFYLEKTYALGDVLMLVPLVRYLNQLGLHPYIRTAERWTPILDLLDIDYEAVEWVGEPKGFGIQLNNTVELDHRQPKIQKFHRLEIYSKCLGIKVPECLDWSMDYSKFPGAEMKKPYVVFQGKGTTGKKMLPNATIQHLINQMNTKGIKVVYIGNAIGKTNESVKVDRKKNVMLFMRYGLPKLFSLISDAECVISMDSAPLWISHFTKTPVITILGPTQAEQRITKHPLYPEGAEAVKLYEIVDCKPCFEAAARCDHKTPCLNVRPERIWQELEPLITKFWEN